MYYQHFARMDAMDNEKLIDLVRSQPVLYDHTHRKYSDNFYKEKLWKEIGAQLNQSSKSNNIDIHIVFVF